MPTTQHPGIDLTRCAVRLLACGHGAIRDRLTSSVSELVKLKMNNPLQPDDRAKFDQIMKLATVRQDPNLGSIAATIEEMSDVEAEQLAQLIFDFYLELQGEND